MFDPFNFQLEKTNIILLKALSDKFQIYGGVQLDNTITSNFTYTEKFLGIFS